MKRPLAKGHVIGQNHLPIMKLPLLIFFFKMYMYLYRICDAISTFMSIMKKDRYYIVLVETMKQIKGGPLNVR